MAPQALKSLLQIQGLFRLSTVQTCLRTTGVQSTKFAGLQDLSAP